MAKKKLKIKSKPIKTIKVGKGKGGEPARVGERS
jgi:hypothetical protein